MKKLILLLTVSATMLLASCANDYHNPAVEAAASGGVVTQVQSNGLMGSTFGAVQGVTTSPMVEARKQMSKNFYGGSN